MTRHCSLFLVVISCVVFLIGLSGCTQGLNSHPHPNQTASGAMLGAGTGAVVSSLAGFGAIAGGAVGGVAGGLIGYDQYLREPELVRLQNALYYEQVQIIFLGDELTLIIPSDRLFYLYSPHLTSHANVLLGNVTRYLRHFNKVDVRIIGYADNIGFEKRNEALTKQQAKNVASYLWSHDIDVRLLTAVGYGSAGPISNNQTANGRAKNRRIEIHLRRAY